MGTDQDTGIIIKKNMYFTKIDNENFAIKPMNCPGSIFSL